ncbi:MAG: DASH family cryptochrome [Flavobacteriaceae bacterium]
MSSIVVKDVEENNSLIWYRNDLRVDNHSGLFNATRNSDKILGFYCFNPKMFELNELNFHKTNNYRVRFLIESVENLKTELKKNNISLIIKIGDPVEELTNIISKKNINNIYFQNEWTEEEVFEEKSLKNKCVGVKFHSFYGQFLYDPEDLEIQNISNVFTNFRKHCEKKIEVRNLTDSISKLNPNNLIREDYNVPTLADLGLNDFDVDSRSAFKFKGGADSAKERVDYYLWKSNKISYYKKTRNGLIGLDYSSKFSAWLSNGSISPIEIFWQIKDYEKNILKNQSTYWLIFELIWRDYFKYISMKYGNKIFKIGGILEKDYHWSRDKEIFNKWINGLTDEPFVNANMVELSSTGWMSNRGRQNVASYLSKELKIDWRWGARYFESMLIDYDVHSNYGNWMYVSGVGNDPRDRKFNIKFQAERYDPLNKYQNIWLQKRLFI